MRPEVCRTGIIGSTTDLIEDERDVSQCESAHGLERLADLLTLREHRCSGYSSSQGMHRGCDQAIWIANDAVARGADVRRRAPRPSLRSERDIPRRR
ncbi:hypothetical protein NSPZN2_80028 [Nitrospira defluvii]|uniref:Uncharacterized protein n=1 Tax=Nitrospira defluvii TaxID=330214 RepID=A0ABM8SC63_9BACT|nr:hypothetical protein NSPZN2_80028 [Nitrospira defluvii]